MRKKSAYYIIALLWFIWSSLHILPGIQSMINTLAGDISSIQYVYLEGNPAGLTSDYPNEVSAVLVVFGQHGFNLLWFGLVTLVCSLIIWKKQDHVAMLIASIVGGLADLGALFASFMKGSIDFSGVIIFLGTFLAILLSCIMWKNHTKQ